MLNEALAHPQNTDERTSREAESMNYAAWFSGAYGDVGFSFRDDGEDRTVSCLTCGEEQPAHFEDGELVADEECGCEDEEDEIDDQTTLSPITQVCLAASPRIEDFER